MAVLDPRDPQEQPVARWRRQRRRQRGANVTSPLVAVTPFKVKQSPLGPSLGLRPPEASLGGGGASAVSPATLSRLTHSLSIEPRYGTSVSVLHQNPASVQDHDPGGPTGPSETSPGFQNVWSCSATWFHVR